MAEEIRRNQQEDQEDQHQKKDQFDGFPLGSIDYHNLPLSEIVSEVVDRKYKYYEKRDEFRKLANQVGIGISKIQPVKRNVGECWVAGVDASFEEFFSDYSGIRLYYVTSGSFALSYPRPNEYNYVGGMGSFGNAFVFGEQDEMSIVVRACAVMSEFFEAYALIKYLKDNGLEEKMGPIIIDGSVKTKITAINQASSFLRDYLKEFLNENGVENYEKVEDFIINTGIKSKASSLYFFYFNFLTFLKVFAFLLENYSDYIFFIPKRSSDDDFKEFLKRQVESLESKDSLSDFDIDVKDMEFLYSILDTGEYVCVPINSRSYRIASQIQTRTQEISELSQKVDRLVNSGKVVYLKAGDGLIKKIETWGNGFQKFGDIIYNSFFLGNESFFIREGERIAKMLAKDIKHIKNFLSNFDYRSPYGL
jgi:hypothetical protein